MWVCFEREEISWEKQGRGECGEEIVNQGVAGGLVVNRGEQNGDRVKEYVSERGVRGNGLEWARRECMDRERWRSVSRGHPLEGRFRRERGVGAID